MYGTILCCMDEENVKMVLVLVTDKIHSVHEWRLALPTHSTHAMY